MAAPVVWRDQINVSVFSHCLMTIDFVLTGKSPYNYD